MKLTFSGILDPRAIKISKTEYDETIKEIALQIYGGKKTLNTKFFLELKRKLMEDVYKFEVIYLKIKIFYY
jgi:hypothetical protein